MSKVQQIRDIGWPISNSLAVLGFQTTNYFVRDRPRIIIKMVKNYTIHHFGTMNLLLWHFPHFCHHKHALHSHWMSAALRTSAAIASKRDTEKCHQFPGWCQVRMQHMPLCLQHFNKCSMSNSLNTKQFHLKQENEMHFKTIHSANVQCSNFLWGTL